MMSVNGVVKSEPYGGGERVSCLCILHVNTLIIIETVALMVALL